MQHFVSQYAAGHTKMSELVVSEHDVTRRAATLEILRAEGSIKSYITTELRQEDIKAATEIQRERLLQSLKYKEINQRRNQVVEAHGTTFRWVLDPNMDQFDDIGESDDTSGTPSSRESDVGEQDLSWSLPRRRPVREWPDFKEWLQSEDNIYWISGKPGLGKSTLVKFLIDSPATIAALGTWRQGTKILSHFFWKAGGGMQNSLKGLWFSLAHQALAANQTFLDTILASSEAWKFNNEPSDWSVPELTRLCLFVFEQLSAPLCIFIDGFDELTESEGASELMESIDAIFRVLRPNVKICLAGRSEHRFRQRLNGAPELQLHYLTMNDMRKVIADKMTKYYRTPGIRSRLGLSTVWQAQVTDLLIQKAEGVFIWLALALESVVRGMENGDSENEVLMRIAHLPDGIDELYKDMWSRSNKDMHIYRQAARRYFNLAIAATVLHEGHITRPLPLLQLAISTTPELQKDIFYHDGDVSHSRLEEASRITKHEVEVRCAGLLEIIAPLWLSKDDSTELTYRTVAFIHRTAYDFLTTTDHGQEILGYGPSCLSEPYLDIAKGILGQICAVGSNQLDYGEDIETVLAALSIAKTGNQDVQQEVNTLLARLESLYSGPFLPAVLHFPSLQSWAFARIAERGDATFSTYTLLNLTSMIKRRYPHPRVWKHSLFDVLMPAIEALLPLGADPTYTGPCHLWAMQRLPEPIVPVDSTITILLLMCLEAGSASFSAPEYHTFSGSPLERPKCLKILLTLVKSTDDLTGRTVIIESDSIPDWRLSARAAETFAARQHLSPDEEASGMMPDGRASGDNFSAVKSVHLIYQVNIAFLLRSIFADMENWESRPSEADCSGLRGLCHRAPQPSKQLIYMIADYEHLGITCYRVLDSSLAGSIVDASGVCSYLPYGTLSQKKQRPKNEERLHRRQDFERICRNLLQDVCEAHVVENVQRPLYALLAENGLSFRTVDGMSRTHDNLIRDLERPKLRRTIESFRAGGYVRHE